MAAAVAVTSSMMWQLTSSFWNRHRRQVYIVTEWYLPSSPFDIKWSQICHYFGHSFSLILVTDCPLLSHVA
jgi:hypothetical protein